MLIKIERAQDLEGKPLDLALTTRRGRGGPAAVPACPIDISRDRSGLEPDYELDQSLRSTS